MEVGEFYGVESLESFMITADLAVVNLAVHPFNGKLPWSHNRLHVNQFYEDRTEGASRDEVETSK